MPMIVVPSLSGPLLDLLEEFRTWVFDPVINRQIVDRIRWPKAPLFEQGRPQDATSRSYLESLDYLQHNGYPPDMYGIDLNYNNLKQTDMVEDEFLIAIREMNARLERNLQTYLGARHPALKAYYPASGYIAWHTNWNAPGYNLIFTYSKNGTGHWKHVDPAKSTDLKPDGNNIVEIQDSKGWHCKAGYFGSNSDLKNIVWHAAYSPEPRLTLSYVFHEKSLWESMLAEVKETARGR